MNKKTKNLKPKEKQFIDKYLEHGNATKAAMEAYDPTSRPSAASIGNQVLKRPHIQIAIDIQLSSIKERAVSALGSAAEDAITQAKADMVNSEIPASTRLQNRKFILEVVKWLEGKPEKETVLGGTKHLFPSRQ